MKLIDGHISSQSPIRMKCECESFQYEFMYSSFQNEGLIGELPTLPSGKSLRPKKKNPYIVIGACKHLVKLAQFIQTQQSKY